MFRYLLVSTVVVVTGLAVGFSMAMPAEVVAQTCGLNPDCPQGDTTRTAALTVSHYKITGSGPSEVREPVEPDTGETWQIDAKYRKETLAEACDCAIGTYTAYVDVDWNGSSWTATCTSGCSSSLGPIRSVSVCTDDSCSASATHSWQYELIVNLDNNLAGLPCAGTDYAAALNQVVFTTTAVDDGYLVTVGNCTLGSAVSPTSQSWSANDTGAFECPFTCAAAGGPAVTIRYE